MVLARFWVIKGGQPLAAPGQIGRCFTPQPPCGVAENVPVLGPTECLLPLRPPEPWHLLCMTGFRPMQNDMTGPVRPLVSSSGAAVQRHQTGHWCRPNHVGEPEAPLFNEHGVDRPVELKV